MPGRRRTTLALVLVLALAGLLARVHGLATTAPPQRIAVIGAGPGGLALANALLAGGKRAPGSVVVFERAPELRPATGGGIQINGGAAVLARLGFGPELATSAKRMRKIVTRKATGEQLLGLDVDRAVKADASNAALVVDDEVMSFTIMRDELQRLLVSKLPDGTLQFNKALASVGTVTGGTRCNFSDGSAEEFDLVVGCDGIRSTVREFVVGGPVEQYSGLRIQFGVAPKGNRPRGTDDEMHQWFGDGAYALTGSYGGIDGEEFEMIALTTAEPTSRPANPNWDTAQVQGECVAALNAAGFPDEVLGVARAATRFFDLGVCFQNPLVPWSSRDGGAVLLGDAAHAMPPFLGQGANQAIQDAYCLAGELDAVGGKHSNVRAALAAYENARKPVTTAIMLESRFLGRLETLGGPGAAFRDGFFWTTDKLGVAREVFLKGALPRV